jgi:hypothetical protein
VHARPRLDLFVSSQVVLKVVLRDPHRLRGFVNFFYVGDVAEYPCAVLARQKHSDCAWDRYIPRGNVVFAGDREPLVRVASVG